jgi:protein-L-isoaspartate(D-aspartate) O-methyltransferase
MDTEEERMTTNSHIDEAFREVPREHFLPADRRQFAHEDQPINIGDGQTNSQPSTVRRMLEWLDIQPHQRILDVGSGSGWTSALLAYLVGPKGHIYAVEKIPRLVAFGRKNCQSLGLDNIEFHKAGKYLGLPEEAPFDRILVSAGAHDLPLELIEQLKPEGVIVIPVRFSILVIKKHIDETLNIDTYAGFAFVPLISDEET